jgi:ribosomal protein L40E
MFCQKCGAKNDEDASFCNSCGTSLIQSKQASPSKKHGILFRAALVFVSIIVAFVVIAVIAAFVSGMAGNTVQNPTIVQYTLIPTLAPPSLDVSAHVPSDWVPYTDDADGFTIYKPSSWTVKTLTSSQIDSKYNSSTNAQSNAKLELPDFVYIFNPSLTGFVMITGQDYTSTLYSLYSGQGTNQISDDLYNSWISQLQNMGSFTTIKGEITTSISSVEPDTHLYVINGNPARRIIMTTDINGKLLTGNCYMIAHGDKYFVEYYGAMTGANQADADNSVGIMQSFTTVNS